MSEEEIIKYIKDEIEVDTDTFHWFDNTPKNETRIQIEESIKAHQGLLDLYQEEKEKNKELKEKNTSLQKEINNYISKDKIKEKIEELENIEPADDDYNFEAQNDLHSKINILQELLKESKSL